MDVCKQVNIEQGFYLKFITETLLLLGTMMVASYENKLATTLFHRKLLSTSCSVYVIFSHIQFLNTVQISFQQDLKNPIYFAYKLAQHWLNCIKTMLFTELMYFCYLTPIITRIIFYFYIGHTVPVTSLRIAICFNAHASPNWNYRGASLRYVYQRYSQLPGMSNLFFRSQLWIYISIPVFIYLGVCVFYFVCLFHLWHRKYSSVGLWVKKRNYSYYS